jgi:hypothetical protein
MKQDAVAYFKYNKVESLLDKLKIPSLVNYIFTLHLKPHPYNAKSKKKAYLNVS